MPQPRPPLASTKPQEPPLQNPGWIPAKAVAAILGTQTHQIYGLVRKGKLAGFRFGGIWRFLPEDVRAYIASCRRPAAKP